MCEISIVIPVYNAELYIEKCIMCIQNQTYSDFELILVNDGSSDRSEDICMKYKNSDKRIQVFSKENGGVSSARNYGIEKAQGKYVVFVDADDEITATYLEDLQQCKEYDYVVSGVTNRFVNQNGIILNEVSSRMEAKSGYQLSEFDKEFFINGFVHTSCGKLYKKSIIDKYHISFPSVRLSEDTFFNLEYLQYIKSWKTVDKSNYIYIHRNAGTNATGKFSISDIDIYVQLHQKMRQLEIDNKIINNTVYAQYLAICLRFLRQKQISNKEKKEILKNILSKKL